MCVDYILTVIIPVFNTGMLLDRCLQSILNQTIKNIKIIIVDDSSTDNSSDIAKNFCGKYPNIEYIKNTQTFGPGYARNVGLKKVKSKYVCFLDSDDWVDTLAYETAISSLENKADSDIAIFGIKTEFDNPYMYKMRYQYKRYNFINSKFALSCLCHTYNQDIVISALLGSKVFRTELLQKNKIIFNTLYFEDEIFSFLTLLKSKNIILLPDVFLHYYQRSNSIMHSFSKKYIKDFIENFYTLRQYLIQQNLFEEYKQEYFSYFEKCYHSLMDVLFSSEVNAK